MDWIIKYSTAAIQNQRSPDMPGSIKSLLASMLEVTRKYREELLEQEKLHSPNDNPRSMYIAMGPFEREIERAYSESDERKSRYQRLTELVGQEAADSDFEEYKLKLIKRLQEAGDIDP